MGWWLWISPNIEANAFKLLRKISVNIQTSEGAHTQSYSKSLLLLYLKWSSLLRIYSWILNSLNTMNLPDRP